MALLIAVLIIIIIIILLIIIFLVVRIILLVYHEFTLPKNSVEVGLNKGERILCSSLISLALFGYSRNYLWLSCLLLKSWSGYLFMKSYLRLFCFVLLPITCIFILRMLLLLFLVLFVINIIRIYCNLRNKILMPSQLFFHF